MRAWLFILLLTAPAGPAHALDNHGIVTEGVLERSAQPGYRDFEALVNRGVRSIVSLRQSNVDWERPTVEGFGMTFKNIPVRDRDVPAQEQVLEFLRFVSDPANQPALVHCQGGRGRTGIMVAAYRVIVEGAPLSDALDEAERRGLTRNSQRRYVQDLVADYRRGRFAAAELDGIPQGRCDPEREPAPHFGTRGAFCLPSCGQAGGTLASSVPCERRGLTLAGGAYDTDYCCR